MSEATDGLKKMVDDLKRWRGELEAETDLTPGLEALLAEVRAILAVVGEIAEEATAIQKLVIEREIMLAEFVDLAKIKESDLRARMAVK